MGGWEHSDQGIDSIWYFYEVIINLISGTNKGKLAFLLPEHFSQFRRTGLHYVDG